MKLSIALAGTTDTAVKAIANGKVANVMQSAEDFGKWEILFFAKFKNKEYYFWYSGMTKMTVRRNDILKAGESAGFIKPSDKIELLIYDLETPIDPAKYLDCKCAKDLSSSK
ncbi:MAG: hypothetical protein ACXWWC_04930 [Chitinophagaceae bacterium]